jgi:signal transduction histidine kinase
MVSAISSELSQADTMAELIERLLHIVQGMRFEAAALLRPDDRQLVVQSSFGLSETTLQTWQLPRDGALCAQLQAGRLYSQPQLRRQLAAVRLSATERACLASVAIRYWLPLISRGALQGILLLGPRRGDARLAEHEPDVLLTLAELSAIIVENVALLEALRRRMAEMEHMRDQVAESQQRLMESREAERLHLAQELHDGPMQDLYGAHFQLGMIAEQVRAPGSQEQFATVEATVQRTITALRVICGELRPPTLAPFGLAKAIRSHIARIKEQHPELRVHLDLMHDGQALPSPLRLTLFRIYQETVANIVKHAEASWMLVRFRLDDRRVMLEVYDNGRGFEAPRQWLELARHGHLGLLGVAERAQMIGGRLEVISAPGEGTAIRVVSPYAASTGATHTNSRAADAPAA